jgi:hypothetical protein
VTPDLVGDRLLSEAIATATIYACLALAVVAAFLALARVGRLSGRRLARVLPFRRIEPQPPQTFYRPRQWRDR